MNYNKWDKLVDSDEEDVGQQRLASSSQNDDTNRCKSMQAALDEWLGRQMHVMKKEEQGGDSDFSGGRSDHDGYSHNAKGYEKGGFGGSSYGGYGGQRGGDDHFRPSGLRSKPLAPYRSVTKEERKVLAMLIALSEFATGETNLTRHPELLELVRHHRWLEEDPQVLELLCRIHNGAMRRAGKDVGDMEASEDGRMRELLMCGINTLAAPQRAKVSGGILSLISQICTPTDEAARENRRKWQQKEFAKEALFDSLFPDMRASAEEDKGSDTMRELWGLLALMVLLIVGMGAFIYFGRRGSKVAALAGNLFNASNATAAANITAVAAIPSAVEAALGGSAAAMAVAAAGGASGAAGATPGEAKIPEAIAAEANDAAAQLRSLEALRAAGALSEEMFAQARERVLAAAAAASAEDSARGTSAAGERSEL